MTAKEIIDYLELKPLAGEGGLFRRSYCSEDILDTTALPSRYKSAHPAGSLIYYLLTSQPDSFSAIHMLKTDETWHFYLGDPLEILLLYPSGKSEKIILGQDLMNGQRVQYTVRRNAWQGARLLPGGEFALTGTTMAPAFMDEDFALGDRTGLIRKFPDQAELIERLTRN